MTSILILATPTVVTQAWLIFYRGFLMVTLGTDIATAVQNVMVASVTFWTEFFVGGAVIATILVFVWGVRGFTSIADGEVRRVDARSCALVAIWIIVVSGFSYGSFKVRKSWARGDAAAVAGMIIGGQATVSRTGQRANIYITISDSIRPSPSEVLFGQHVVDYTKTHSVSMSPDVALAVDKAVRDVSGGKFALAGPAR